MRVFQLRDGDVRACVVPADLAVNLDMMADMSEPVAQAYLDALALCETESVATLWFTIRSVSFRHAIDRSWNCDARRLTLARRIFPWTSSALNAPRCDRAGSYRRDGLRARFGPDIAPARSAHGTGAMRA